MFALLVLAASGSAHAFSSPEAYVEPAISGGGGGRFFTGSPADGYGCDVCHDKAESARSRRFPLYVSGLAMTGFEPAQARQIVLSWPEFAARHAQLHPDPAIPLPLGSPAPTSSVVTELVAESGKGSGTIEIDALHAAPDEQCARTSPTLAPRLAARLYQVRRGVEPLLIKPDDKGILRCVARQLGQRCVIATTACGAKVVRFTWIAPPQSEGAVWFSAGFVASENLSGTPDGDSYSSVTFPMFEDASESDRYESTLRSACSVALERNGTSASGAGGLLGVACCALFVLRARSRRRPR